MIALACAKAGLFTLLFDLDAHTLDEADRLIRDELQKNALPGAPVPDIPEYLHYTKDLQLCLADLFIDAGEGGVEAKQDLFNQLAELNHSECIFAAAGDPEMITRMAAGIMHPGRVIGLRFPLSPDETVQLLATDSTDSQTRDTMMAFVRGIGR